MNVGDKFGRWTVESAECGSQKVQCKCICGTVKLVYKSSLHSGKSTSCGCFQKERAIKANTKHNQSRSLAYQSWHSMMNRCFDEKHEQFKRYGGAGISVCEEWKDFNKFFIDMGERPDKSYSIDRIDNNLGYSKSNCRWATKSDQAKNRSTTRKILWNGLIICASEFASLIKTNHQRVFDWLNKGKTPDEIFQIISLNPTKKRS